MYRSTLDPTRDTQAGLAGPLVVARPGTLNSDGKPDDVDKEIYLMLQVRAGEGFAVWCVVGRRPRQKMWMLSLMTFNLHASATVAKCTCQAC